jgi:four helix bundle protein
MGAHNIHELAVFRLCDELMKSVEAATATGRVAMDFKFCDQVTDAALDAAADVAEGFARFYPGEFARFLDYAIASLAEVRMRTEAGYRQSPTPLSSARSRHEQHPQTSMRRHGGEPL